MSLFTGFEEILKCVIENTAFEDDKKEKSDEERFHDALKAIFGNFERGRYVRPPAEYEFADMVLLHQHVLSGDGIETFARKIAVRTLPQPETGYMSKSSNYKKQIDAEVEKIKKHYGRYKWFYEREYGAKTSSDKKEDISDYTDFSDDQKEKIIQTLRESGWPI